MTLRGVDPADAGSLAQPLRGRISGVLAVVAHPDDESFGLGGALEALIADGATARVLCFTHGEASTLRARSGDLARIRAAELEEAAAALGVSGVELMHYPDGRLAEVPVDELAGHVLRRIRADRPSHLLAFDLGGVTGHPDHHRATQAAVEAARLADLPVLAWALPSTLAERLNTELGTGFVGRAPAELDIVLTASRERQERAIACHHSQSADNPVLRRRLELLGDREYLRIIHQPPGAPGSAAQRRVPARVPGPRRP